MTSKPDGDIGGTIVGTIVGVIALIYVSHLYYEKFIRPHGYSVTYTKRQQYTFNSKVASSEQVRNPLIDDSIVKSNSNIEDGIRKSQRAPAYTPVRNPLLNHLDNHNNSSHNNNTSSLNKNDSHNNSNSALDEDSNEITEDVVLEGIVKSGYLFKKATNLRKEWLRRWVFIKDSKLYYIHKPSDLAGRSDIKATLVSNLLLSTVKEISPREFHVISPGQRKAITGGGVYELQTDSEADTKSWVQVIRQQILGSLMSSNIAPHHNNNTNNNKSSPTLGNQSKSSIFNNINNNSNSSSNNSKAVTENKYYITLQDTDLQRIRTANPRCADCFALNPDWVSINLCQVICIDCSGIHRSLGSHISKVRSLVLDKWTPYSLELLIDFGNEKASSFWEAKPIGFDRTLNSNNNNDNNSEMQPPITRQLREYFITQKYIHKTFRDILLGFEEANVLLLEACRSGDLLHVYIALANQANVNIKTPAVSSRDYIRIGENNNNDNEGMIQTPLHLCCRNNYLLCAELLCIWNASASFDEIDAEGKTPIDVARERNFTELVAMLNAYKNRS